MAFNMLEAMGVFNDAPNIPEIVMLDIDQLHDSEENFYYTKDEQSEKIRAKNEELKASIEMFGVMEPLIVKPIGNDEYDIVSGHRRRFISKRIVDEGKAGYRKLPCIVDAGGLKEEYETDFTDTVKKALMGLKLIQLNSTAREIDGWQQTEQVKRTKEKLLVLKENGVKMPGGMRNQIALLTGMSRSEVGRHEQIAKNLDEDFKEAYKNGEIVEHAASELAAMPAADQRAVYEKTNGKATVKDISEYRKAKQEPPAFLIIEGQSKPKKEYIETEEPIDSNLLKIEAAKFTMSVLEKAIEKCNIEIEYATEQNKPAKRAAAVAKISYVGAVMLEVQKDLFEITGDDMFQEEE